jgi:hypothetical protein
VKRKKKEIMELETLALFTGIITLIFSLRVEQETTRRKKSWQTPLFKNFLFSGHLAPSALFRDTFYVA